MDILSDVSINGSLTVNKDLNIRGVSTYSNYLAVNSAVFATGGIGFTVGSVDITKETFNFNNDRFDVVFIPNIYVCGILYGDSTSVDGVFYPSKSTQTNHLNLLVPDGCQKFMITKIKDRYLPSITILDSCTSKKVEMDLSIDYDSDCGFYYAIASRTLTDDKWYDITVIE